MSGVAGHLQEAGECVRAFNHARVSVAELNQPSDVYGLIADLYTVIAGVDQAIGSLVRPLEHQLAGGQLQVVAGAPFEGDPAAAVAATTGLLRQAQQATGDAYKALSAAQEAISGLYNPEGE